MQATEVLRHDHAAVKGMFEELERLSGNATRRQELMDALAEELEIHAQLEEELFYPALSRVSARIEHAKQEHAEARKLIGAVEGHDPTSAEFAARLAELRNAVLHHVATEEGAIFADARQLGEPELERLGQKMMERKQVLKTSLIQRGIRGMKLFAKKIA